MEGVENIFAEVAFVLAGIIMISMAIAVTYANKASKKIKEIFSCSLTNLRYNEKPLSIFSEAPNIPCKEEEYTPCVKQIRKAYLMIVLALLTSLFLFLWTAFFSVDGTASLLMLIGTGAILIMLEVSQIALRETYEKTKELVSIITSVNKSTKNLYDAILIEIGKRLNSFLTHLNL
ncbi:hypothetical protein J7K24_02920 [bacterium]|nr:hypothetical protein [bacterium]